MKAMNQGPGAHHVPHRLPQISMLNLSVSTSGAFRIKGSTKVQGGVLGRSQDLLLKSYSPQVIEEQSASVSPSPGHMLKDQGPLLAKPSTEGKDISPTPRTPSPQQPKVRKILVDLQSALEQVWESEDAWEGSNDSESCTSGKEREQRGPGTKRPNKSSKVKPDPKLPVHLPPIQSHCKQQEEEQALQRKVTLVKVLEDGTLSSQSLPKASSSSQISFPRIILQPPGKQRIREMVVKENNAGFEFAADLQIPISLLLQKATERINSRNHTQIAQLLRALRQTEPPTAKE
uniref:Uncharacterized protein LOC117365337 n=1 Tax=Geotrypetes seraphini TaxID=260995 RepID=A0A6P8S168_GEOSA|nr:uncharacterized protein LOC117365337 [Geotrypetes seraphini]